MELRGGRKNAYLGEDSDGDEDEGDDPNSGRRMSYSSLSFSIPVPSLSCFWFTFPCVTFLVLPFSLLVSSSVLSQLPYSVICLIVLLVFSSIVLLPSFLLVDFSGIYRDHPSWLSLRLSS